MDLPPNASAPTEEYESAIKKRNELSGRELQVLQLTADGQCAKAVARTLGITESTVKVHRKAVIRKLKVENSTHAAAHALRRGIIS